MSNTTSVIAQPVTAKERKERWGQPLFTFTFGAGTGLWNWWHGYLATSYGIPVLFLAGFLGTLIGWWAGKKASERMPRVSGFDTVFAFQLIGFIVMVLIISAGL